MFFAFILQAAADAAANIPTPEKQPALLSLIYIGGFTLIALLLGLSLLRNRRKRSSLETVAPADLPEEVRQRLGSTSTNRGLRFLRYLFVLIALAVFGFHVYWAIYAEERNERFQELSYKDLRNRRLSESTLRGWIFDRTGKLDQALALYRRDASGHIVREYPEDQAMAHLFGSDRGDPGLERALFGIESLSVPEALDVVRGHTIMQTANTDVQLTIHRELQKEAITQLKGRPGAVVVLNPQNGEVLAIYSNPSYSLKDVQDEATWIKLDADKLHKPLVNRALGEYYIPGSTFKTVTMIAAFLAGMQDTKFTCTSAGFVAAPGANPIWDDQGPSEVHGTIGIDQAYEVSCNQYFAQMGVKLGPEKLKAAAQLLGIGAYDTSAEALRGRKQTEIWNASTDLIRRALAPREATIVAGPKTTKYEQALEGYGQGPVGQMTPFQMALAAASIANLEGRLMKPKMELNRAPEVFHQVMSPQVAARLRHIMGLVTASGTGRGAMAQVHAAGIITGGKTGTAQKILPVFDPVTGEPKTRIRYEKDIRGKIIGQHVETIMDEEHPRIDSWFLCIAPLNSPTLAIAVIVEGGGYGSKAAAPIAAALVLKARDLGLLGNTVGVSQSVTSNANRHTQQSTSNSNRQTQQQNSNSNRNNAQQQRPQGRANQNR